MCNHIGQWHALESIFPQLSCDHTNDSLVAIKNTPECERNETTRRHLMSKYSDKQHFAGFWLFGGLEASHQRRGNIHHYYMRPGWPGCQEAMTFDWSLLTVGSAARVYPAVREPRCSSLCHVGAWGRTGGVGGGFDLRSVRSMYPRALLLPGQIQESSQRILLLFSAFTSGVWCIFWPSFHCVTFSSGFVWVRQGRK